MQRKHDFIPGEFYHIYNRGNSKQNIFLNDYDRERFVKSLYLSNSTKNINFKDDIIRANIDVWDFDRDEQIVSIGAWVLMPNHFHIYLTPLFPKTVVGNFGKNGKNKNDGEKAVSTFVKKLLTSYSKYFNKNNERTGGLFEGPFKSVHVETDEQAKYLFSYIHLNPIKLIDPNWKKNGIHNKKETLNFLNNYKWSSYHDHKGSKRPESKIISLKDFPEYFLNISDFDNEILDWLSFQEDLI